MGKPSPRPKPSPSLRLSSTALDSPLGDGWGIGTWTVVISGSFDGPAATAVVTLIMGLDVVEAGDVVAASNVVISMAVVISAADVKVVTVVTADEEVDSLGVHVVTCSVTVVDSAMVVVAASVVVVVGASVVVVVGASVVVVVAASVVVVVGASVVEVVAASAVVVVAASVVEVVAALVVVVVAASVVVTTAEVSAVVVIGAFDVNSAAVDVVAFAVVGAAVVVSLAVVVVDVWHSDCWTSTTCHESPAVGTTLHCVWPEHCVFAGHPQAKESGCPTFVYLHSEPGEHPVAELMGNPVITIARLELLVPAWNSTIDEITVKARRRDDGKLVAMVRVNEEGYMTPVDRLQNTNQ
jgi:hypothetical protein